MEEKYQRKMQTLMRNEGVSQSRLAKMLEVKSSTLSHILAGRNYPSFDILQKLRRLFPHINADWLLRDTCEDYLADVPTASTDSDRLSDGNAPYDAATVSARGVGANTRQPSGAAAEGAAATVSGQGVAAAAESASGVTVGRGAEPAGGVGAAGPAAGTIGDTGAVGPAAGFAGGSFGSVARGAVGARSVGSASGAVRGAKNVGSAAGVVGCARAAGGAQGMAAPSLFDTPPSSDVSSAATDAASSTVAAQMSSSFDCADGVRIRRIIVLYDDNSFESFTQRL